MIISYLSVQPYVPILYMTLAIDNNQYSVHRTAVVRLINYIMIQSK